MCKRATRHADLWWLHAITAAIQSLQFTLDGCIGRLRLKGALHMPDRIFQLILFVVDNAHTHMRNEIVRHRHQYAAEYIHSLVLTMGFQIGFTQQSVGFQMFWKCLENMPRVSNSLIRPTLINEAFDLTVVSSQNNFRHCLFLLSMPDS